MWPRDGSTRGPEAEVGAARSPLYSALIGLASLVILLQGVWAGIFLEHDGHRDAASSWIDVHPLGGDLAVLLAALATVVAFLKLRRRKDLWIR